MRVHGTMVYFLINAHQNANYCIPEGHGSATLFTRPFYPFCIGGAGQETIDCDMKHTWHKYNYIITCNSRLSIIFDSIPIILQIYMSYSQ